MYCTFCGTKLDDDAKFCTECGNVLDNSVSGAAPAPVTPTPVVPTPVVPTPVTPTPVVPTPVAPAPVVPTPVAPAPVTPTPVVPTPVVPAPVAPAPVVPTPVAPAPVVPTPVVPTPVAKPAAPKPIKMKKKADPDAVRNGILRGLLLLISAGLSALAFFLLFMEESVTLVAEKGSDTIYSVRGLLEYFSEGSNLFHPTLATSTVGTAVWAVLFTIPFFALLAFVFSFLPQKSIAPAIGFSLMSILYSLLLSLGLPLTLSAVGEMKHGLILMSAMKVENVVSISFTPVYLFSALLAIGSIAVVVLCAMLNKRRCCK